MKYIFKTTFFLLIWLIAFLRWIILFIAGCIGFVISFLWHFKIPGKKGFLDDISRAKLLFSLQFFESMEPLFSNNYHQFKYCGVFTTQPDEDCYLAPQSDKLAQ